MICLIKNKRNVWKNGGKNRPDNYCGIQNKGKLKEDNMPEMRTYFMAIAKDGGIA